MHICTHRFGVIAVVVYLFLFSFVVPFDRIAEAKVSKLLRDDGDIGDPLPSSVTLGKFQFGIIPDDGAGDQISTVHWTAVATDGDCSKDYDLGTDARGIIVNLASLGTVTIKADFTYRSQSTWPPTPVGPNSVTATITVIPPSGFKLLPFDQTATYNFADSNGLQVLRCRVSGRRHFRHPFSYHRRGCRNGRATEHPASES